MAEQDNGSSEAAVDSVSPEREEEAGGWEVEKARKVDEGAVLCVRGQRGGGRVERC